MISRQQPYSMNNPQPLDAFGNELAEAVDAFCRQALYSDGRTFEQHSELSLEKFLATATVPGGRTFLHVLCDRPVDEHADRHVAAAIANGADPNALDDRGRTPLHLVCSHEWGHTDTVEIKVIDLLVRAGALVDCRDCSGQTPLLSATIFIRAELREGNEDQVDAIVERLIHYGAGVNVPNVDLITPLHIAVANEDLPMTKLLLQHGASRCIRTTGTSTLYNNRLILLDNHVGVPVPIGSTAVDLGRSAEMKAALASLA
jgi:hypothetical protein